jgi:argininosuccinate lyase
MARAAGDPALLATDLAEHLVSKGVPFREAHAAIAGIVTKLESEGRSLADVKADEWRELHPQLDEGTVSLLDPETSISRRTAPGGPSPDSVIGQIKILRSKLSR